MFLKTIKRERKLQNYKSVATAQRLKEEDKITLKRTIFVNSVVFLNQKNILSSIVLLCLQYKEVFQKLKIPRKLQKLDKTQK